MGRLIVQVEGGTEEEFVGTLLAPHLERCGWQSVKAIRMGRARSRDHRHGVKGWDVVRSSVVKHLKEDAGCYVTTMADYYALPATGSKAWPGRAEAKSQPPKNQGAWVQQAMSESVSAVMGPAFDAGRFIPFVVMHEFEGLLFSDCRRFAEAIYQPQLASALQAVRDKFANPEEINDSPATAPSKVVEDLVHGYSKPLMGNLAALGIGLETLRRECPHFGSWIQILETLVQNG